MALKVTLLHTMWPENIFYEKSSRAELFRCGNCESARGTFLDLSFHTKFLARGDLSFRTKFLSKSGLRAAVEC